MKYDPMGRPGKAGWLWTWDYQGSGKNPYAVSVKPTGVWGCSCPASRNLVDGRECTHVLRIKFDMATTPEPFATVPFDVKSVTPLSSWKAHESRSAKVTGFADVGPTVAVEDVRRIKEVV
jgi:hypothetical protein